MDLTRILEAFTSSVTPLIRTDFSDDGAWQAVIAQVTKTVDFNDPGNADPGDDGYSPSVTVIDDPAFEGVDGARLGQAISAIADDIAGYVLLADARAMRESGTAHELTLDYVDLSVMGAEDAELFNTFTGRAFRVLASEFAAIEANLAISNMDFNDFADATAPDGVFRGFDAAVLPQPVWPVEREPGLAAARAVLRDLRGESGARPLSGVLGSIVLEREFAGTRTRLFNRVGSVFGWPPCQGGSGNPDWEVDSQNFYDATLPEFEGIYEQHGSIRTTIVDVTKPARLVRTWNWLLPDPDGSRRLSDHQPLLENDAVLTLDFSPGKSPSEEPSTHVRLRLTGIPVEWEADFAALWTWDIVRFASQQ